MYNIFSFVDNVQVNYWTWRLYSNWYIPTA